jgi:predicted O-methyltransferase YrrM
VDGCQHRRLPAAQIAAEFEQRLLPGTVVVPSAQAEISRLQPQAGTVRRRPGEGQPMPSLTPADHAMIARLWARKLDQDARRLPQPERHRNLEPESAEFIAALAAGIGARRLLEIGGSSGISTIALAAAARRTGGRLVSIEIEPARQAEARRTLHELELADRVDFVLDDAARVLADHADLDFALIDGEKEDYLRFFAMLRLAPGAVVVADNILSHDLADYVAHVRARPGAASVTLPIGKGLEVTRLP